MARLLQSTLLFVLSAAFARAEGDLTLFESGHVRPIALSPSGRVFFAVNTPDARLEVFRVEHGTLLHRGEVVVGLDPVAVAVRDETEVWVVNHLSDSVSIVHVGDPARPFVMETVELGDEPRDIVFAGSERERVFVSAARRGQSRPGGAAATISGVGRADIWILDANAPRGEPRILTLFCDTPRALAVNADGSRVYAAAFHSGNGTTVLHDQAVDPFWESLLGDDFTSPGAPDPRESVAGVPAPATGLIVRFDGERWLDEKERDWSPRVRLDLPDLDVFEIDALADGPIVKRSLSGVGTTLFNMALRPSDSSLWITNLEARNHERFESVLRGRFVSNRVTITHGDEIRIVDLNPHIDFEKRQSPAADRARSLALPTAIGFLADGSRAFVAAMGSGLVGVLDGDAKVVDRVEVGGGPTGLLVDELNRRLWVMDRFENRIAVIDLESLEVLDRVPLRFDPEPEAIRAGRPVFYDATTSSAHGDVACASCHIFGDLDSLAWDLGDPAGEVVANPLERADIDDEAFFGEFHPMKGPLATQSLRGLREGGAMHWRGDRNGGAGAPSDPRASFLSFRSAFTSLLGRDGEIPADEMERLADFVLELRYPPNPNAALDGSLTATQKLGKEIFDSSGSSALGGDGQPCTSCHELPSGASVLTVGLASQDFEVAQLRNLYQKVGMFGYAVPGIVTLLPRSLESTPTMHAGAQVRGFGFSHDGAVPTLFDFFRRPRNFFGFPDEPGRSGLEKIRALEDYLLVFPTGLRAAVGQQVTLARDSLDERRRARLELLLLRARLGDGDVVLHGQLDGAMRGFVLEAGSAGGPLQSDRRAERLESSELLALVESGRALITGMLVPRGNGRRLGLDRDRDGVFDRDEVDAGSDPADATSATPGPLVLRGDCNLDSRLDLADAQFTLGVLFLGAGPNRCATSCDANESGSVDIADVIFTLNFLFLGGPPPGGSPDCEPGDFDCLPSCVK